MLLEGPIVAISLFGFVSEEFYVSNEIPNNKSQNPKQISMNEIQNFKPIPSGGLIRWDLKFN